ncbi:cupredoxin domain-containing protein [Thermanaerothrix daxensis]|uniref:hypothetical protein n=1 Tax=Thermanaerothrix daxensis TaxID=869279 RepID=UPI0006C93B4F|nr:hypothetical protein [Thermanaerothrix daxensis]
MATQIGINRRQKIFGLLQYCSLMITIGAILWLPLPFPTPPPTDRHIRVEAQTFQFTPGEIRLNPGDRVTLELISTDVVHGLSLDGYSINLKAEPGQPARITFTANRVGVFRFRCSITCGNLHPFMIGKLQVGPNMSLLRGTALGGLGILLALSRFFQPIRTSTRSAHEPN